MNPTGREYDLEKLHKVLTDVLLISAYEHRLRNIWRRGQQKGDAGDSDWQEAVECTDGQSEINVLPHF